MSWDLRLTGWDAEHDCRTAFLACMDALSFPGTPVPLPVRPGIAVHPAVDRAAGALLALLEQGYGLAAMGDPDTEAAADGIRRATGAHPARPAEADFVLVGPGVSAPVAERVRRGGAANPELGATVLYAGPWTPTAVVLDGPGLAAPAVAELAVPVPDLIGRGRACADPPTGIDLLVFGGATVTGLPRGVALRIPGVS
nr:phosphonate C-P lyase system protein PhnH [Streptomyces sp. NBC_00830]